MIYVLSGGQTGATLTVNSSGTGTITVSNATLGKSYSKTVTTGGSAVFKGLKTGTWTVKLTDGTQTSTKTVVVTSDYSTNIAYFSASINITYPAKSTCVVKNSSGQTVASDTNTGTSAKTWTATVNAIGTYTVTATATDGSEKSKSQSVSITKEGQFESVKLSFQLILFDGGDNTTVTGGWKADGHGGPTAAVGTTVGLNINASGDAYQEKTFIVATKNTIDMSGYTKLCATITKLSATEGEVRVVSEIDSNAAAKASVDAKLGTVEVDISSLNSGKVGLWITITANAYGLFMGSVYASKIWLE